MIHPSRIKILNVCSPPGGTYVLYWMQASQRSEYNHALEYSIEKANKLNKPLVVFFGITDKFPEANLRHYAFMLEGLSETAAALDKRGIRMMVKCVSPEKGALEMSRNAVLTVTDRGYCAIQNKWRFWLAKKITCPLVQVESDVIVPVETASPKEEYSAGTFRPKLQKLLDAYLVPLKKRTLRKNSLSLTFDMLEIRDTESILQKLKINRHVSRAKEYRGGTASAKKRLLYFIREKCNDLDKLRNEPSLDYLSNMSPYLHFGQVSPLYIALQVKKAAPKDSSVYLEELIVRRELSMNFIHYNPHYDRFEGLPAWARKTLCDHKKDKRGYLYSLDMLEAAETHDPYWNAAQNEMTLGGKMHGYMRMYWGKKILEWSPEPEEAFLRALYLNNKYSLDGRDPNGFTGVAWCFGKHDRAWKERPIFGKVRYMNAKGLERKFNMNGYVKKISQLKYNYNLKT